MPHRFKVLVIEDEGDMREALKLMLTAEGFEAVLAKDALTGLRAAYQSRPDIILLDVGMPQMDGFEACRRLREMTDVPIIFVTGNDASEDVVRGFSLGADDYVTKPFERSELISRLNANLRRVSKRADSGAKFLSPSPAVLLDCDRHELIIGEKRIYLAPKEFQVTELLIRHAGRVLSRDAILTQVWGPERIGEPDLVKQCIYRLRQKVEANPQEPVYLHSVRGRGYYFEAADLL